MGLGEGGGGLQNLDWKTSWKVTTWKTEKERGGCEYGM
jgi:hypothetical protein